jgi:hypothetical protein
LRVAAMTPDSFGDDAPVFMDADECKDGLYQLAAQLASLIGTNDASEWIMDLSGEVLELRFVTETVQ